MRLNFEGPEPDRLEIKFVYKCAICEREETILSEGLEICMPLPPAGWQWVCASKWNRRWICITHYDEFNVGIDKLSKQQARAKENE